MVELGRLLLFPCLVFVGWMLSRTSGERVRIATRLVLGALLGIVVALGASGNLHDVGRFGEIHKWLGHGFVTGAWWFVRSRTTRLESIDDAGEVVDKPATDVPNPYHPPQE